MTRITRWQIAFRVTMLSRNRHGGVTADGIAPRACSSCSIPPPAGGDGGAWRARSHALGLQGLRPDVAETAGPGHAAELAREAAGRGEAMVVAAGGDGTIAEVASGLAGSAALLGILPLGTANVLAWELGLPPWPERAARVLSAGRPRPCVPGLARFGRRRVAPVRADGRGRLRCGRGGEPRPRG